MCTDTYINTHRESHKNDVLTSRRLIYWQKKREHKTGSYTSHPVYAQLCSLSSVNKNIYQHHGSWMKANPWSGEESPIKPCLWTANRKRKEISSASTAAMQIESDWRESKIERSSSTKTPLVCQHRKKVEPFLDFEEHGIKWEAAFTCSCR